MKLCIFYIVGIPSIVYIILFSKFQHFGSNHRIKNKVIHLKSYVDKTQIDYVILILKEYSAHEINAKTW
jgi:hypothetical protein